MKRVSSVFGKSERWKLQSIFALLFVLLFMVILAYQKRQISSENVFSRIQKTVLLQQNLIENGLLEISELYMNEGIDIFESEKVHQIAKENQISVFALSSDSILFWSENTIGRSQLDEIRAQGVQFIKLKNGYFLTGQRSLADINLIALALVKHQYPFENAFLRNTFAPIYDLDTEVLLFGDPDEGDFLISGLDQQDLFSINIGDESKLSLNHLLLLLIILIIAQSFVYALVCTLHNKMAVYIKSPVLQFIFLALDLLIIRFLQRYFQIPSVLYESSLFSATFYSSGFLFANFGELILNVLTFLFIALHFFRIFHRGHKVNSFTARLSLYVFIAVCFHLLYLVYIQTVESLLFHSSIPLSFAELYQLNALSYISFLVLSGLTVAFYLFAYVMLVNLFQDNRKWALSSLVFLVFMVLVWWLAGQWLITGIIVLIFPVLLLGHALIRFLIKQKEFVLSQFLWPLFFFSLLLTIVFYQVNKQKHDQDLQLTAFNLSIESDPVFEFLFSSSGSAIIHDTVFQQMLIDTVSDAEVTEAKLLTYLNNNHLTGYFERFNIHLTVCDSDELLNIQPEDYLINCLDYFDGLLGTFGQETETDGLYLIRDNLQGTYYLSQIFFELNRPQQRNDTVVVYLEFYSKFIPEGLGYPELLVDEGRGYLQDLSKYSFARYADEVLVYKFGNYMYPTRLSSIHNDSLDYFNLNGFRHLAYAVNEDFSLIVSKRSKSIIDILAPFTYFFIFIGLLGLLVFYFGFKALFFHRGTKDFRLRLQLMIVGALVFSFVVIGSSTALYIQNIYEQKNKAMLTEKTQSILIEIEHKLKDENIRSQEISAYLYQLLVKFSMVFYSDINLYDLDGKLLASSRPEIFERGLLSELMNPIAYRKMHHKGELFFLQQESINTASYLSSYIPFSDSQGNPVAYINLPYFARESELRNEISTFVLTYVNIFFLLTGLSVIMALLLSRQLTRPLVMIQEKMRSVKFNSMNEKIAWKANDEIGQLITQYNNMIDELQKSAELLARSERESAWREMARQVAHEIKNPLTPMRLSVQHLLKAWQENDPEMETKLKRTSQTLVEQIDTLSEIASAFSDFAKMPRSNPERLNLEEVIQNAIGLYSGMQQLKFNFKNQIKEPTIIFADKKNLNRVFSNLFKNAIQAVEKGKTATINIELNRLVDNYRITIADNGKGMTPDQAKKIFTPYFTTKSSGMGVGLSIVYNIITSAGGTISFETEAGKGTVFTILLPSFSDEETEPRSNT